MAKALQVTTASPHFIIARRDFLLFPCCPPHAAHGPLPTPLPRISAAQSCALLQPDPVTNICTAVSGVYTMAAAAPVVSYGFNLRVSRGPTAYSAS